MRISHTERLAAFSRRAMMLGSLKGILGTALLVRLYQLQVVDADQFRRLADENRVDTRYFAPPRGLIIDRFGRPLAFNQANYRVVLSAGALSSRSAVNTVMERVDSILTMTEAEKAHVEEELTKPRHLWRQILIREYLDWTEVSQISVHKPYLPGIIIVEGMTRYYPFAETTSHIVGYISAVAEEDRDGDPMLDLPGYKIGKKGAEKVYDRNLRGQTEVRAVEVDVSGRERRILSSKPHVPGQQLVLGIDMELQRWATEQLTGYRSGSAVVMDVRTGDVLALASVPGFDPNLFSQGLSVQEWNVLSKDSLSPLMNKAVSGQYNPGSVFKLSVALSALEVGLNPRQTYVCKGHLQEGRSRFHCWKKGGHGVVDLRRALVESCDVYFYQLALKLGIDRIAQTAVRLGMGERLGLDLPSEAGGLIPTRGWKEASQGGVWQRGDTMVCAIGQGYVLTSPLQLAVMVSRLVNGGKAVRPRIALGLIGEDRHVNPQPLSPALDIGIDPAHLSFIRRAMEEVVNTPTGTAFSSRLPGRNGRMGGKTGTSQVRRITLRERASGVIKNVDLPWEERDHSLFVGYAPINDPRYSVSVVVEHGGSGSRVAAKVAKNLMMVTLRRDPALRRNILNQIADVG